MKFAEYEAAGIREYWIVDPLARTISAYRLVDGRYVDIEADADGKLHSQVIDGWWLSAGVLFADRTPNALDLMKLLGVV